MGVQLSSVYRSDGGQICSSVLESRIKAFGVIANEAISRKIGKPEYLRSAQEIELVEGLTSSDGRIHQP